MEIDKKEIRERIEAHIRKHEGKPVTPTTADDIEKDIKDLLGQLVEEGKLVPLNVPRFKVTPGDQPGEVKVDFFQPYIELKITLPPREHTLSKDCWCQPGTIDCSKGSDTDDNEGCRCGTTFLGCCPECGDEVGRIF